MRASFDAVIVGARCAGATLALELARQGRRVALVDKATFPSDTLSTHMLFPNSLARLESLGVMDRLRTEHRINPLTVRMRICGYEIAGGFTPVGGYDYCASITRPTLDKAIVDQAVAAGAEPHFGEAVAGLLGAGTQDDPIAGVVLENGETLEAPWVFGADGRTSFVARTLGLAKRDEMAGDACTLFAYWRGLPEAGYNALEVAGEEGLAWFPSEDDVHLVAFNAKPHVASGVEARKGAYAEGIRRFPAIIDPGAFDRAEQIGELRCAPETMLRGFFKQATGLGWALVGDAGHFKHPASAQGISDAIEQALWVANALNGKDPMLQGYERWRDARADGHYQLSFTFATWPVPGQGERLFAGIAGDPVASQQLRDVLSRIVKPSELFTSERLAHWFADPQPANV